MRKAQEATMSAAKRDRVETEPAESNKETVATLHKREKSLTEITMDGHDATAASQSVIFTSDDTVDGGDHIDVRVEPPRMTKLKVRPVSESDRVELDVDRCENQGAVEVSEDVVEQIGDTQGKHDWEEGKDTAGDREETVLDRGDKETAAGVTEYLPDVTSTGTVDADAQHREGNTYFSSILVSRKQRIS